MKYFLFLICLWSQSGVAQTADTAKKQATAVINEIIGLIQQKALIKDSIDYNTLNKEIAAIDPASYTADSIMLVYLRIVYKHLRAKGDRHSFYMGPKSTTGIKKTNASLLMPVATLLDGDIVHIKIPSIGSLNQDDLKRYADTMRQQIEVFDTEHSIKGWVVDLRKNGGGNMWPMIAALNPIIRDGTAGYFIDINDREDVWTSQRKNPLAVGKLQSGYKCKNLQTKIAVLIDSLTASSGEMTAVSLFGLPNVKSFGQLSAGLITVNSTFPLSNGGMLLLANKYVADRNRKLYTGKITPDRITNYNETLDVAIKWLLE